MDSSLFADFSSLSSPLEQVFGQVPKGHDKALRQVMNEATFQMNRNRNWNTN